MKYSAFYAIGFLTLMLCTCSEPPQVHEAVKQGDLASVQNAMMLGADVNAFDQEGNTSLYLAVSNNHQEIVRHLVEHGANVNSRTSEGFTPLIRAAENRDLQIMEYLISKGARVDVAGNDGYIALHAVLINAGIGLNDVMDMVQLLLINGANVNANSGPGQPLHYAVGGYGYPEIVELLLAKGAHIDAVGPDGTALSLAACRGNLALVELLLSHHADPNIEDYKAQRPLHHAARRGNQEIAKALLEHGTEIDAMMLGGITPLIQAMKYYRLDMVKFLLDNGADPNVLTPEGTALDKAEKEKRNDVIQLLYNYRAKRSEDLN